MKLAPGSVSGGSLPSISSTAAEPWKERSTLTKANHKGCQSSSVMCGATRVPLLLLLFLLLGGGPTPSSIVIVRADWGDYADHSFQCPALTTCQRVCVANVTDCPPEMLCNGTASLCNDGTCQSVCPADEDLESPCPYNCAKVACAKVMDYYDNCTAMYGSYYDAESECGAIETEETITTFTFTEPPFIFCYAWLGGVTLCVMVWAAYNQRIAPIHPESTQPLMVSAADEHAKKHLKKTDTVDNAETNADGNTGEAFDSGNSYQTGYTTHPMGYFLMGCVVITLVGIQVLLGWLTVQYYVQQGAITKLTKVFQDEVQVLLAFEIVWMVGFVWTFCFKWPFSLWSLFYRRCPLSHATYVAVCLKRSEKDTEVVFERDRYIRRLRGCFMGLYAFVRYVMTGIFSDQHTFGLEQNEDAVFEICRVSHDANDPTSTQYFVFMFRRYILEGDRFVPGELPLGDTVDDIAAVGGPNGLDAAAVDDRRRVVGPNVIHMPKPTIFGSVWKQASKGFYTYQMFFVWTWMNFWYYYMALVWLFVILIGMAVVVVFQHRNETTLYKITRITGTVAVVRQGETLHVPQEELVPGDVLVVEPGLAFCDMLLISGDTTLVDEGALTGEAHPVGKLPVDPTLGQQPYDLATHKRNTILAGTTIIESENSRAIVLKTASFTARGELIRDIFNYRRHQFKFDHEVPIVLAILFFYAIFGFAMAFYWTGEVFAFGWFYGMFVVATVIPPLLPTVFTVSVGISDDRLARQRIACTQSESILVAGKVKRAFFDKTGTLTKQGLDFVSARSIGAWNEEESGSGDVRGDMALGMAVCHSLTQSKSGALIGNPVDQTMFGASGGGVDPSDSSQFTDQSGLKVTVVRHFEFDFHRMTQSVIVRMPDGSYRAFVKGSGESVKHVCTPISLPTDFDEVMESSALAGIYQISMATKPLPSDLDVRNVTRDEVESNLVFCGCINFKNLIRDNAASVIRHLEEGEIDSIMVTGDSVLTGICIAKEAGIIKPGKTVLIGHYKDDKFFWTNEAGVRVDLPPVHSPVMQGMQLAVSGRAWESLLLTDPDSIGPLMDYIRVFGRCNPRDKVSVVSQYVKAGHTTCMCGDGGNDCGALKMAHIGVALSDSEASIVAPFTSMDKDIESVVTVIREGRCSLSSALASYKFMIMYGQVETLNQLMNAYFLITFTEWCWVWMDGIWTITLAFALPLSRAADRLSPTRPTASLLGPWTMSSVLGILAINFSFTVGALSYLNRQDWYQCRKWDGGDVSNLLIIGDNYETEVIFLISGFQYVIAAMAYNFGYEFRRAWIRNYVLVALVIVYTTIQFYITLVPSKLSCVFHVNCENENGVRAVVENHPIPIQNPFNTTVMPEYFRNGLIGLMVGNILCVCGYDYLVVNGIRRWYGRKRRLASKVSSASTAEPAAFAEAKGRSLEEAAPSGGPVTGAATTTIDENQGVVYRSGDDDDEPNLSVEVDGAGWNGTAGNLAQ